MSEKRSGKAEKTVDYGISVGTFTAPGGGTFIIYNDLHQRKHVQGFWPGDTKPDKPLFRAGIYDANNLAIAQLIASSLPWGLFQNRMGGIDVIFNCGRSVVGTDKETDILVQGGFQGDKITFHCYPVEEDSKRSGVFRQCKRDGRYLNLNLTPILG